MRPVLANLGFVLQFAGLFMIVPIVVGFYYNEATTIVAYFLTLSAMFILGFLLNTFSQRAEMDFKASAVLITSTFVVLGLIGSIPYLYLGIFPGDVLTSFTHSYFESISAFTTTGLSFVSDPTSLPYSMVAYRAVSEWIAGIGIIFILLSFFYNGHTVSEIGRLVGLDRIVHGMKLVLGNIIVIYSIYAIIISALLYVLTDQNIVRSIAFSVATLATGGLSPVTDIVPYISGNAMYVIMLGMILGALSFVVHGKLLGWKVDGAYRGELILFLAIMILGVPLFHILSGLDIQTSAFHVIAASTTSGLSTIDISGITDSAKLALIVLMFFGGMSLSTAGGIKIYRVLILLKSIPWAIDWMINGTRKAFILEGHEMASKEILPHIIMPILVMGMITIAMFIFVGNGRPVIDSLFDVTSASSLVGLSVGVVNIESTFVEKWVIIALMVIGRVEVLTFLVAITLRLGSTRRPQISSS